MNNSLHDRIIQVLLDQGVTKSDGSPNFLRAEKMCGIKPSVVSKAVKRGTNLHPSNLDKFIKTFHVNPTWLRTGNGQPYAKVEVTSPDVDHVEKKDFIQALSQSDDMQYISKRILDEYELFPKTSLERSRKEQDKTIEALERYIAGLEREIEDFRSGRVTIVASSKKG